MPFSADFRGPGGRGGRAMARPYLIFNNLRIEEFSGLGSGIFDGVRIGVFGGVRIGEFGGLGGGDYRAEVGFGEAGEVVGGDVAGLADTLAGSGG